MLDYFKLLIFPYKSLDKFNETNLRFWGMFLIWILAMIGFVFPEIISVKDDIILQILLSLLAFLILFFPFVYGISWMLWIFGKGFKGIASYNEIKRVFVLSLIPIVFYLPFSILLVILALKNDKLEIIGYSNKVIQLILWIISFRILITGIAKFNKFSYLFAVIIWFIVGVILSGIALMMKSAIT
jgi:hypothetical protein